jgi:dTDP-4-dehydrorhamnose reductase
VADRRSDAPALLVTGGSGLLGRHVVAMAAAAGWEVNAPSSAELDVRDAGTVDRLVEAVRPAAVAHLAYRRDDRQVIVEGSSNIADAAAAVGARLVHMSTDALFAGRHEPYTEADAPTPVHDYGRWKAAAETEVATRCDGAVSIRTSLMYAGDGTAPCQVDVRRVLDGEATMAFFTDEFRCFTRVDDVAAAVLHLAGDPSVTGPLHVVATDPVDRAAFARHVARWLGRDPDAVPVGSIAASGLDRPGRVVLDATRAASHGITCRPLAEGLPVQRQEQRRTRPDP